MDVLTENRRRRGEASQADIEPFFTLQREQLLEQLSSSEAVNRTCAATVLGGINDPVVIDRLCLQLAVEKKLYCKIAVSNALVNIGFLSVKSLLVLLGDVGNNQEKEVPTKGFNKISYPLPRDIVARTLCRIGPDVLAGMLEFIQNTTTPYKLEQAIDVIGHVVYSYKLTITSELLLGIISEHSEFSMVHYKMTRCFSGFSDDQTKQFLLEKLQSSHVGFKYEAARSLLLSGLGLPESGFELPQEVQDFVTQLSSASNRTA